MHIDNRRCLTPILYMWLALWAMPERYKTISHGWKAVG